MKRIQLTYTLECDQELLDTEEINEAGSIKFGEDISTAFKEKYGEKFKSFKVEFKELKDEK